MKPAFTVWTILISLAAALPLHGPLSSKLDTSATASALSIPASSQVALLFYSDPFRRLPSLSASSWLCY